MNQNHVCGWKTKRCPKNVMIPPNEPESLEREFPSSLRSQSYSLEREFSSSLRSQSYSGWCVSLVCEWQLSCFKLPIDLVSHGLAHGPWREAFVCSQPCTLPICCWDGLQCCHHPHQQQEDLCFLCFLKNATSCSKLLQITPWSTSQPFKAIPYDCRNKPVQIRGICELKSNCPLLS